MHDFIELILRLACLLAALVAVDSPDNVVWLAFAHLVPLAVAAAMIIVALPVVVVVAACEVAAFLFFFVRPTFHHVP